jgi:hypothetical protein
VLGMDTGNHKESHVSSPLGALGILASAAWRRISIGLSRGYFTAGREITISQYLLSRLLPVLADDVVYTHARHA